VVSISMDPRLRARRIQVMRVRGRRRLRVVVGIVALAGALLGAWWTVMYSPFLDVDHVTVIGADRTSTAEILTASGIEINQPLVEVDTHQARALISELPWVHSVTSDRRFDGRVEFTVVERLPVAALRGAEHWLLVDRDGRVLEVVDDIPNGLIAVSGSRWQVAPGDWVGETALPALDVAALLPAGLTPKVASVQSAGEGLELLLFGGGRVVLGDTSQLEQKFLSALTLLVRLDLSCLDRIDVRAPSVPVLTRVGHCS